MKNWYDISEDGFVSYLSQMRLDTMFGGKHYELIDPAMSYVYWSMSHHNSWFPPSQIPYTNKVVELCGLQDTPELRRRIGYLAYPAFVRQHHFGIVLVKLLGVKCVIGGALLDASYGTDWLVTDPLDSNARLHAIHLSLATLEAQRYARTDFKLHVFHNHDIRLNLRDGIRVGKGVGFLLHPPEHLQRLLSSFEQMR